MDLNPTELAEEFRQFRDKLDAVTNWRPSKDTPAEELLELLIVLKGDPADKADLGLLGTIQVIAQDVAGEVIGRMKKRKETVGGYIAESYQGGSWVMDSKRLAPIIAMRAAEQASFDRETGEVRPIAVVVEAAVEALLEACNLDRNWRMTKLKEHGIDPAGYGERSQGKPSLKLTKAETIEDVEQGAA